MSGPVIAAGVFLAAYISWRPADVLFTASDAFFVLGTGMLLAAHSAPLRPFGPVTAWWQIATLLMLLGLFIGSLFNGDPDRWLIAGAQYCFTLLILPMLLMNHGDRRTVMLAKALLAGVVAMEAFGIAVYWGFDLNYEQYSRISHDFVTGVGRLGAFLGDANWNACAIVSAIPFALYLRIRGAIGPLACFIALTVLITGLILAASVTGIVSAILSISVFMVISRRLPSFRILSIGFAAFAVLFVAGVELPRAFEKRIAPAMEQSDVTKAGTFAGRMDLVNEAWAIVDHTALVGLGVDQYRKVSVDRAPVHNIYLLLWAEGGLLALFGWLGLLGILTAGAWAARHKDRLATALALSVFSTFVVFSNAAPHMYARFWLVPVFLAMAPAFATIANERTVRQQFWPRHIVSILRGRAR